ncbi:amino acid ABC transporter substrate-binding protein [Roseateles sp. DAIF2]|uniref:substrate-binding periplasmic protein n=1 Tax=Roseateles sp. DAIF2 TaxID=2714952 RepID=UPI0018A258EE|nr:transporter substrate-binding domain-containing protein [Roseateles sp. DAIF2]QPF73428.1 amino acid ABC transporter substrate-binding protein [Roseateles sp. DAIF2]
MWSMPRVLLASLLLGIGLSVQAANTQVPSSQPCGPYRVAFYEYGAMYFRGEQGQGEGVDKELVDELARRTGCRFITSVVSRVATWVHLARGTADITVSAVRTPQRELHAEFAIYLRGQPSVYVRSELAGTVDSLQTFVTRGPWKLAISKGYSYGPQMDAIIADLRQQGRVGEYGDANAVARVIGSGKADAFIASNLAWSPIFKAHKLEGRVAVLPGSPEMTIEAGLAFSRERVRPADIALMTQTVAEMRADGRLKQILGRHGSPEVVKKAMLP